MVEIFASTAARSSEHTQETAWYATKSDYIWIFLACAFALFRTSEDSRSISLAKIQYVNEQKSDYLKAFCVCIKSMHQKHILCEYVSVSE